VGGSCQPGFSLWHNEPTRKQRVTSITTQLPQLVASSDRILLFEQRAEEYGLPDTRHSLM
jgi:hypothetical protein